MPPPETRERVALGDLHGYMWPVVGVVGLAFVYSVLLAGFVRPYLWPAGTGAIFGADPAARRPLLARPPSLEDRGTTTVTSVADGSPAAMAGIRVGDAVLSQERDDGRGRADLAQFARADASRNLEIWRDLYRAGVSGPIAWRVQSGAGVRDVRLPRPSIVQSPGRGEWARRHLGTLVQTAVFTLASLMLLLLRSNDRTAALSALALALSAVGSGGPLLGVEHRLPIVGPLITVFAWIASPLAFPTIALAVLYFPTKSALVERHPWVQAVPLAVAAPMLVLDLSTGLYLSGVDGAGPWTLWGAAHPAVYGVSFAAGLALNLAVIVEGMHRYRVNPNGGERRRIRMALYTAVPGVAAFAVKDGIPVIARLAGLEPPEYPVMSILFLQALVLLPAFGLVYAVGVAHVLGPRVVLRRSLQYALASRTLRVVALLPPVLLVVSLAKDRDLTIRQVATGSSGAFVLLTAASLAALRYRDRARQWLDERFFREEYDARTLLLSVANRVRFETNPADLASMVAGQIDAALHPEATAILVAGQEEGRLTPLIALHANTGALPLDGALVAMLRWSDDPLDVDLNDPRSPVRRLPPPEREWLEATTAALLIPVVGQERELIAVIALGEKRSEEAYSTEDRELLASIAAQMGLGFDVARLRAETPARPGDTATRSASVPMPAMTECHQCGRCDEAGTALCSSDGSPMTTVQGVPRTIGLKYRMEQLLGRGGMGAVYRARDLALDRLVAVKVVRAELLGDTEARRRFRREAQIVARLQHPSIVSVFDFGTFPDGGAYLVMELVRGEDLRHVLQREGRLDAARALSILTDVCGAIEAAHREGVLHRDLKPENILLPNGDTAAKVLDFGVAKVVSGDTTAEGSGTLLTTPGMLIGTPAYMAPEQFQGTAADPRTDVFALGVIAYEMLWGDLPFGRGSFADIAVAQARGPKPVPSGSVSAGLERVVLSALSTDPGRRPATPQVFARELNAP